MDRGTCLRARRPAPWTHVAPPRALITDPSRAYAISSARSRLAAPGSPASGRRLSVFRRPARICISCLRRGPRRARRRSPPGVRGSCRSSRMRSSVVTTAGYWARRDAVWYRSRSHRGGWVVPVPSPAQYRVAAHAPAPPVSAAARRSSSSTRYDRGGGPPGDVRRRGGYDRNDQRQRANHGHGNGKHKGTTSTSPRATGRRSRGPRGHVRLSTRTWPFVARAAPENAPGDLFVDDRCIACDTCRPPRAGDLRRRTRTTAPSWRLSRRTAARGGGRSSRSSSCPVAAIGVPLRRPASPRPRLTCSRDPFAPGRARLRLRGGVLLRRGLLARPAAGRERPRRLATLRSAAARSHPRARRRALHVPHAPRRRGGSRPLGARRSAAAGAPRTRRLGAGPAMSSAGSRATIPSARARPRRRPRARATPPGSAALLVGRHLPLHRRPPLGRRGGPARRVARGLLVRLGRRRPPRWSGSRRSASSGCSPATAGPGAPRRPRRRRPRSAALAAEMSGAVAATARSARGESPFHAQ